MEAMSYGTDIDEASVGAITSPTRTRKELAF